MVAQLIITNMRIKFSGGKQREFFNKVLLSLGCPSVRELANRLAGIRYNSLKDYYCERRLLPSPLFNDLLKISNLSKNNFDFEEISEHWGQSKGGKISKK